MINAHDITALVLAGGRGTRMGGVDKGLQTFNGTPLALHTLLRLQMQQGGLIGEVMINANRLFPPDLAVRLADALGRENADIAMAAAREEDGQIRTQPVFCLLRADLLESLVAFTHEGGRKIDRWTALHKTVTVPFDQPNDDPRAFFNANTLAELHSLETR